MNSNLTPHHAAQAMIEQDHQRLAHVLKQVTQICRAQTDTARDCADCAQVRQASCRAALAEIGTILMNCMLEHFRHEDVLMSMLTDDFAIATHCVKHRREHVAFAERLRQIVDRLYAVDVPDNARRIEAFVMSWIRTHALEYDAILAQLLKVGARMAPGGAASRTLT